MSRQKKEFEEYEINESYKTEARDNPYGFKRKSKEERPVLAICYDFDKTLSPDDMQAQGYIQSVNYHVDRFWAESNEMARANGMDSNLAYMYKMVREAKGHFDLSRKALEEYGSKVELFPGVDEWFERVRQYGDKNGVIIEHYIISSGLKEMIEGTEIAKRGSFEEIYASAFYYDENGVAIWPAQAVNYTSKTQFLFRIEKGNVLYAPCKGKVVPLTEVPDPTFSEKLLGEGFAVIPTEGKVYAPADAEVTLVFDTLHAITLTSSQGAEILIHIGLDTVTLKGAPFTAHVAAGDKVKKGDLLMDVDLDKIKEAGLNTITPVLICNTDDYEKISLQKEGDVLLDEAVLKIS